MPAEQLELIRKTETLEQLASFMVGELEQNGMSIIPQLSDNGYSGQLIARALEYIAAHFTENLTLQSVADTIHLSKSYFSLLFKKQTGRNFIDYLIELRIREAKRLLAQDDSRIYDVAQGAGFNDVKYFSKVFKKGTGFTPVEYRESLKCSVEP
ncbi:Bifunctional transcriptional activator/DNA repair enzyme AdaA [compost metagenome]